MILRFLVMAVLFSVLIIAPMTAITQDSISCTVGYACKIQQYATPFNQQVYSGLGSCNITLIQPNDAILLNNSGMVNMGTRFWRWNISNLTQEGSHHGFIRCVFPEYAEDDFIAIEVYAFNYSVSDYVVHNGSSGGGSSNCDASIANATLALFLNISEASINDQKNNSGGGGSCDTTTANIGIQSNATWLALNITTNITQSLNYLSDYDETEMITAIIILLPLFLAILMLMGGIALSQDHVALKIGLFLFSFIMFFAAGHLGVVAGANPGNFDLVQEALADWIYWISIVFGVMVLYFILYAIHMMVAKMANDKKEKMKY